MSEASGLRNARLLSLTVEKAWQARTTIGRHAQLGGHELSALQLLADQVMGPAELARILTVSTAAATGIVDRLAARDLVERRPDAEDRRRTAIHLTAHGRASLLRHLTPMLAAIRGLEEGFTEAESAVVTRYLERAIDAFSQVAEPNTPPE
ncbi:MarR family transcriptional regulator [Nocardioides dubius]|uniref:HTH marR-type domain-containing protein n=1 Tax=Nocardioides dubius TaxID=317019 RepID=A0ABP4E8E6_9ACTN